LRVAHVITGLDTGGAETLLVRLLERLDRRVADGAVISLKDAGTLGARIEALGVPVRALELRPRPLPSDVAKLRSAIRASAADLVQTWMLHANVLGGATTRFAHPMSNGRAPVVWGVHVSVVDPAVLGKVAALTQRAERALSRSVPVKIVACSQSAFDVLTGLGYPRPKLELIPNGFDLDRFHPDSSAGRAVRRELGIPEAAPVVGHVARFHPIKDHRTLLAAAQRVAERIPNVRFVLCGAGVTDQNPALAGWAAPLGERVHLLGERGDVGRMYHAFDLAISSSSGEALPLVIGEAMASGIPVVATRCGDSPQLVGATGRVVPVRDPDALADATAGLLELPDEERRRLGEAARHRIADRYDIDDMAAHYVELWQRVLAAPR
jgi:glycosyltransferase involved in cell wall biosynthesis